MGCFSEILESMRSYYNEDDLGEELVIFLGTLRKFNYNEPLDQELKSKIEKYFNYRGNNDKNHAIRGEGSIEIYD